ncbi:MAG: hypothetical protein CME62_05495 [Halobacteriovoraceae bacterium]|nr:hypothetical protein [Halobacteriovoraceae bacterium]|tara:strand:+ start:1458 stop:3506 length:2049 start_codon:yes stop_codon:yes gene_type:complete
MTKIIIPICLLFSFCAWSLSEDSRLPDIDERFRKRVDFWKKVYTEIDSKSAFIHDKEDLTIIYKKVKLKANNYRQRSRSAYKEVKKVRRLLRSIYKKRMKNLTQAEKEIVKIAGLKTATDARRAINRVRSQYGLKDNYFIGLKRSHRYLDYIKKVFAQYNLPKELIYLPHVESSFNYRAYSKVGAAGIWQFMRSTGRMFGLKFTYVIDERRDPFKATVAAAKLLRSNYDRIKNWPLAITGYNHGIRSMERALKKVGSGEIADIIEKYDGRRFGFASKNFYATFIATVEISQDPSRYFPEFKKPEPFTYSSIPLPKSLTVKQILKATRLNPNDLKLYNPAIRSIAYRTSLQIPKGYDLQLPSIGEEEKKNLLAKLEALESFTAGMRTAAVHKIRKGDNLYIVSKMYQVPMHDIIVFNQIANPSRIYPGMKIKIPGSQDMKKLKAAEPKVAKVEPQIKPAPVKKVKTPPASSEETELRKEKEPGTMAKVGPKISWFEKLFKSDEEIIAETPIEKVEAAEAEEESQSVEKASKLVSLDNYHLDIKNLSEDLYEIQIETDETLGHYADWAVIRISNIRRDNRLNTRSIIRPGQELKLRLTPEQYQAFVSKRAEYHMSIQEDFYQAYRVTGTTPYRVRRGDTLNQILQVNEVPMWLFRKYQDEKFKITNDLIVGQNLTVPTIQIINE